MHTPFSATVGEWTILMNQREHFVFGVYLFLSLSLCLSFSQLLPTSPFLNVSPRPVPPLSNSSFLSPHFFPSLPLPVTLSPSFYITISSPSPHPSLSLPSLSLYLSLPLYLSLSVSSDEYVIVCFLIVVYPMYLHNCS